MHHEQLQDALVRKGQEPLKMPLVVMQAGPDGFINILVCAVG